MTADQPDEGYSERHAATGCTPPFHTAECQDCSTPPVVSTVTADQVATAAELDALPVGSVVLDRHADAWQKQEDTELLDEEGKRRESAWASTAWMVDRTAEQMFSGIPTDTSKYSRLGPFTVLYRPDRPAPQVDRETLVADAVNLAAERSPFGHPLPDSEIRAVRAGVDSALAARADAAPAAPQVDEGAVERAARALYTSEQTACMDDEMPTWAETDESGRAWFRDRARAALAAARVGGDAAPAAPLRTEWGVLLDDLGSVDEYDSRYQAEAARHLADGDLRLVRIETWEVVRDGE